MRPPERRFSSSAWCGTFLSSLSFCLHTCASWRSLAMHNSTADWRRASCDSYWQWKPCRVISLTAALFMMPLSSTPPPFIQCDKHLPLFLLFISTRCSSPPICEAIWSSVLSFVSVCSVFALWIHLTRLIEWTSERYKLLILMGVAGRREVHCWFRADEWTFLSVYLFFFSPPTTFAHLVKNRPIWCKMLKHFDVLLVDMLTWCKKKKNLTVFVLSSSVRLSCSQITGGLSAHPGGIPTKMAILLVY